MIKMILDSTLSILGSVSVVRIILGFILVFILPGFAWTLVFFYGRQINHLERLALSVGLSIAIVTLSILAVHLLFGVSITSINSIIVILGITIIPVIWYYFKRIIRRRQGDV